MKCVALKKSKSLSFVSKGKFLESDGVNSNHENIIKKAGATLRFSEKQVLLKLISSHQEVFSKIGVLKIQTSHYGLYKI